MTSKSNIYILSQPIQTGKTTLLSAWCKQQHDVGGILTPDVNGKRMLLDLSSQTMHPFQLSNDEQGIKIGRFTFSENAFKVGRECIREAVQQGNKWIVIDEVGRLEINDKSGFGPQVSDTIQLFKIDLINQNLLLVIRDYLLLEATLHYQLQDAIIVDQLFFQTQFAPLVGVVLCGGQSVRMGCDKAFITYHQQPQFAHVHHLMQSFCKDVWISCNEQKKTLFPQSYSCVVDNATFENCGPMTGVLSAFQQQPNHALLVIGCDYPQLNLADIKSLVEVRSNDADVVCYYNSDSNFTEPLLAIYEPQCAALLKQFWQSGQTSLNQFLKTVRTKTILAKHNNNIKSVDFNS